MKQAVVLKLSLALAALGLFAGVVQADPAARDINALYSRTCAVCHVSGAAGAPKTGDAAAWQPRLVKGMDALVNSVRNGMGAMPPRGVCMDCSDAEYQALIELMAKGS